MTDRIQEGVRYMIQTHDGRTILGTGDGSSRATNWPSRGSERHYYVRDETPEQQLLVVADSEIKELTRLAELRESASPFEPR